MSHLELRELGAGEHLGTGRLDLGGHGMARGSEVGTVSPATVGRVPSETAGAGDRRVSKGRVSDGHSKVKEGAGLVDR